MSISNKTDNRPIGVFDSGLGGLTSVRELERLLPGEDIVYFGDTGRVPYGTRSAETVRKYSRDDLAFLLTHDIKAVLIACGTVSSIALDELCSISPVPVIGVVRAASRAAVESSSESGCRIGVLGTPATARNGAYEREILALSEKAKVMLLGCPMFVPLVENGYFGEDNPVTLLIAKEYIEKFSSFRPDALILGCTHYPLIRGCIERACREVLGYVPAIVDSGACAALGMAQLLSEQGMLAQDGRKGRSSFYVSDEPHNFSSAASVFLGREIDNVTRIEPGSLGV